MAHKKHGHEGRYMSTCKTCVFEHARLRATKLGKGVYLFHNVISKGWDFSELEPCFTEYEIVYPKASTH